ncbi:MAG: hypothetical protein IKZ58_06890 [Selenomonadaceae bacterium]|nr:hypothetical protein [Selenomonadaceae bacterium]
MNENLIEKYKEYCNSEESYAVLFVKKHLKVAKGKWIDIIDFEVGYHNNETKLEFKNVVCELFEKNLKPEYPPKGMFGCERDYILACRAITWETAHEDIAEQRQKHIKGFLYSLRGVRIKYKNNNYSKGFFRKDSPAEIKALAKDLNDRTNPLWDIAFRYINREEEYFYKYKFVDIKRLSN